MSPVELAILVGALAFGIGMTVGVWAERRDGRAALQAAREPALWIAYGTCGDDTNEPAIDIVGVFSTETIALGVARRAGFPKTASAERFHLNEPADWARLPTPTPGPLDPPDHSRPRRHAVGFRDEPVERLSDLRGPS